jgi:hypothetical protein
MQEIREVPTLFCKADNNLPQMMQRLCHEIIKHFQTAFGLFQQEARPCISDFSAGIITNEATGVTKAPIGVILDIRVDK